MAIALGACRSTALRSRPATPSCGPAASGRSKPASRSPATPAGCAGSSSIPNSPTTISDTLALGGAGGDGAHSYAARRRNLACHPPAQPLLTAHTKACRTTAPDLPADPQRPPARIASPILANTAITDRGAHTRPLSLLTSEAKASGLGRGWVAPPRRHDHADRFADPRGHRRSCGPPHSGGARYVRAERRAAFRHCLGVFFGFRILAACRTSGSSGLSCRARRISARGS